MKNRVEVHCMHMSSRVSNKHAQRRHKETGLFLLGMTERICCLKGGQSGYVRTWEEVRLEGRVLLRTRQLQACPRNDVVLVIRFNRPTTVQEDQTSEIELLGGKAHHC